MVHRVGLGLVGAVAFRVGLGLVGVVAFRVGLGQVGVVAFRVGVGLGQVEGGGREGRGSKGGFCNKTSSSLNYQTKRQFDVTLSNLQTDKHTNALQLFMLNLTTTLLLSHGTQRLMAKLTYAKDCDTRRHHLSCPSRVCVTHMIKIN